MPSLEELLLSGSIRPLAFSDSREQVHSRLGPCEGEYAFEGTIIEKYGPFQLHYKSGTLTLFEWTPDGTTYPGLDITDSDLSEGTSLYEFLDLCDEKGIPWVIESGLSFDRQLCLRTSESEQVLVFFDLDRKELESVVVGTYA